MSEGILVLLVTIMLISVLFSIPIIHDYFEYNKNPISVLIEYINDIKIIGDIAFGLLLVIPWILSIIMYLVITIFYNKHTIKLMNVRIK